MAADRGPRKLRRPHLAAAAIGQLPAPTASRLLAGLVVQTERPELRREALFWLVQSGGDDAFALLECVLGTNALATH